MNRDIVQHVVYFSQEVGGDPERTMCITFERAVARATELIKQYRFVWIESKRQKRRV
jgi:hypothetical protein